MYFDDDDVTAVPIEHRNVGMVFQSYALFPNMTVADNIAYGLQGPRRGAARRRQRVEEMLEMMQIAELRKRRIDQLSGGQKQRVALARAIAVQPRVLLLDEPLTALDALLRERLRIEIDVLLRSLGITAVYVTHDQAEAMAIGDRIAVMNNARVVQIGAPRDIYFRPAHPLRRRVHRDDQPPEGPAAGRPAGPARGQHPRAGARARGGGGRHRALLPARARDVSSTPGRGTCRRPWWPPSSWATARG